MLRLYGGACEHSSHLGSRAFSAHCFKHSQRTGCEHEFVAGGALWRRVLGRREYFDFRFEFKSSQLRADPRAAGPSACRPSVCKALERPLELNDCRPFELNECSPPSGPSNSIHLQHLRWGVPWRRGGCHSRRRCAPDASSDEHNRSEQSGGYDHWAAHDGMLAPP